MNVARNVRHFCFRQLLVVVLLPLRQRHAFTQRFGALFRDILRLGSRVQKVRVPFPPFPILRCALGQERRDRGRDPSLGNPNLTSALLLRLAAAKSATNLARPR